MATFKTTPATESPAKSSEPHLIFRVGSHDFALPTRPVRHLVPSLDLFPVTDGPPWFAGLLRLPDITALAIDLRIHFRLPATSAPQTAIAVDLPHPELPPVALLADRLSTTELFRKSDIRPLRESSSRAFQLYVNGVWRGRSRPCFVLDIPSLLSLEEAEQLRLWLRTHL